SSVRSTALRSAKKLSFRWLWDGARCELSRKCLEIAHRVTNLPAAKRRVIGRMRVAVSEHYMSSLLKKYDQGKVFGATADYGVSNPCGRDASYALPIYCYIYCYLFINSI
ncbi:hypothetical protein WN51_03276, partial [Melipona quadrifasciata]